jgi:glycosyltransferase involved in cell wall biosynthesis
MPRPSHPSELRVCVVTSFAFPGETGSPLLQMQTVRAVASRVAEVYVLRYSGWRGWRIRRSTWEGVDVLAIPAVMMVPALLSLAVRRRPDAVLAGGMLGGKVGSALSVVARCRVVLELHFAELELAPVAGSVPRTVAHRAASWLVRRRASAVVAFSELQRDQVVASRLCPRSRTHVIYPSVEPEALGEEASERPVRPDSPVVGYAGNFRPWQGIDLLLEAARLVWAVRPDVVVELWGSLPGEVAALGALADDTRVRIHGRVPAPTVPALLRSVDVLVLPRPDLPQNRTTASKLGEYLASGRPVVVTDVADHRTLVADTGAGIVVEPSVEGIAKGILAVLEDPESAMVRAERAVTVAEEHFGLGPATERRIRLLLEAAGGPNPGANT